MMKKNKLYTVNKFNRPMFMPEENLFKKGGSTGVNVGGDAWNKAAFNSDPLGYATAVSQGFDPVAAYKSSKNWLGLSKEDNPFSKGNLGTLFSKENVNGALKGGAESLASAGAGLVGSKVADAISGGLTSKAGSVVGDVGSTVLGAAGTALAGPVGGAVGSFVGQTLGGVTNALFGEKVDAAKLGRVEGDIAKLNSFTSNAGSFDEIQGPEAVSMDTDVYEGGLFNDVSGKNEELKRRLIAAKSFANRSVDNNIYNLADDQLNNALANYSALGGPINTGSMGALEYDIMSGLMNTKRKNADNKNQMTNMFMGTPKTFFDFGGVLQTHGADWSDGLITIGTGGTHEENKYDGVQLGVDENNVPNLVEEGETIFNSYVFSNRILADEATKKLFHLPKKKDISFADISKKLEKEIAERPNDVISRAGFEAQMQTLEEQQERQKQEMEAERAKAAFEALTPEEQTALMQQKAQQEAMAQEAAIQQQVMAEQQAAQEQSTPEEMAMMQQQADGTEANVGQAPVMAEGGHLFPWGGLKDLFSKPNDSYTFSKGVGRLPWNAKMSRKEVEAWESQPNYKKWTDYVKDHWDDAEIQDYLKELDLRAGGNHLFGKDGKPVDVAKAKKYWEDARTDKKMGYYHAFPTWQEAAKEEVAAAATPEGRIFHALEGDDDYIQGELDPNVVGDPVGESVKLPNGDTVIYHARKAAPATEVKPEDKVEPEIEPVKKWDGLRYAGLFGPAVGLGMQMAGIGRPDYGELDAAVSTSGNVALADYKPLGNYLTYRPMDIWFEQNRMDANARATDRAIMNTGTNQGAKMAGLLASGYNNQIADGELYRKALEYNDAKRQQVAEFNRGTDQFNAQAYNQNQQFNAAARNDAYSRNVNARLNAAQQKLANDAGWYNSLYGNVSGLFKGISDLGRENRETNWRNALVTAGAFGAMDNDALVKAGIAKYKQGKKSSKGGKINKKRGLTY